MDQWLKAGQHAAARSAHVEAIGHFDRGLAAWRHCPKGWLATHGRSSCNWPAACHCSRSEGYSSGRAAEAYTRARELAERRGDTRHLFTAVYGLWQSTDGSGRVLAGRGLSDQLLRLTARSRDGSALQAHHSGWTTCLFAGEPAAAREHCEAGRRLYDPERHRSHRLLYGGHDPGVCDRNHGRNGTWLLGYPERLWCLETKHWYWPSRSVIRSASDGLDLQRAASLRSRRAGSGTATA